MCLNEFGSNIECPRLNCQHVSNKYLKLDINTFSAIFQINVEKRFKEGLTFDLIHSLTTCILALYIIF